MVDDTPIIEIKNTEDANKALASFIETKDIRYFQKIKEYLSNRRYETLFVEVSDPNDLNINTGEGSLIDYIIDNINLFSYKIAVLFKNDMSIIKMIIARGKIDILDSLSEKMLFQEYENGKTLFEYLLDNSLLSEQMLKSIYDKKYEKYIDLLKQKDKALLKGLNGYMLHNYKVGNVSCLEYLFQSGLIDDKVISKIYSSDQVYDLCIKYNREDLLIYLQENILKSERNGKTILENLIDKNMYPKLSYYTDKKLIKILLDHKKFDYFISSMESDLLAVIDGDKTLLEILLENGQTPETTFLEEKDSLDLFLKYNRYDLVSRIKMDTLMSLYDLNRTYLDYILEEMKDGLDFKLTNIIVNSKDFSKIAQFYISVAKHGFIEHVDEIKEYNLTKNNGKLLKELLRLDKDLTVNTILTTRQKQQFDIAMMLRLNGIEQKDINIDLHSMNIVDKYFETFNAQYKDLKVSSEEKALLEEFRILMLSDDLSTPEMVDATITSYTYLMATKNPLGIREIKKLIEIKKADPRFAIRKEKRNSFYRELDNSINLENVGLNTLNHETGHALYHNLTDQDIPEAFEQILYEIRNNPQTIIKVGNYSNKFHEIRENVAAYVDEHYMKDYHLTEEELSELDEFINKQKEERKKEYLEQGYDEETLDPILEGIFTKEEYIEQDKRIKREELIDAILRSEYGAFITIGDILDAIYIGKFRSGEVRNRDNNVIRGGYGHGIAYYNRDIKWSFDETMANFSAIMKSENAREIMTYLREIVGDRFINCISDYYINQISLSTKQLKDEEEKSL